MNRLAAAQPTYEGFHGAALAALVATIVVAAMWMALLLVLWFRRAPRLPRSAPETAELGPEPPAVANLLVNEWHVTSAAVPATLVDLAARRVISLEEVGPDRLVVRTRPTMPQSESLTTYERQVLRLVESRATGGSAPVDVLRLGTSESDGWLGQFSLAVVKDAETRGLASRGWPRRDRIALAAGLALALGLLALALELAHVGASRAAHGSREHPGAWFGLAVVVWIAALMGSRRDRVVRATRTGREACVRWLGVRAYLRRDESFADQSPAGVAIWGRMMAYGVALGANRAAAAALPIGPDDPDHAWSRQTGSWRQLRIHYPRRFGYGESPRRVLVNGVLRLLCWSAIGLVAIPVVVELLWRVVDDATQNEGDLVVLAILAVFLAVPTVAAVYVGARIVDGGVRTRRGAYDLRRVVTVEGPVVKVHAGYFAVDDGTADDVVALPCLTAPKVGLGDSVRVRFTPKLHHVDEITVVDHDDKTRTTPTKEATDGVVQATPADLDIEH